MQEVVRKVARVEKGDGEFLECATAVKKRTMGRGWERLLARLQQNREGKMKARAGKYFRE